VLGHGSFYVVSLACLGTQEVQGPTIEQCWMHMAASRQFPWLLGTVEAPPKCTQEMHGPRFIEQCWDPHGIF
jgi:hypothetical protein